MAETLSEILEKYPYLKEYTKKAIIVEEEVFNSYKSDEKIKIGIDSISTRLLKELIQLDKYYEIVKKLFSNEIEDFRISYITNGDIGGSISLNKATIIKGLDTLITQGISEFDEQAYRRYDAIKSEITYDKFLEKYQDNNYNIKIEGNKYSIPINKIIEILNLHMEEFNNICTSPDIKEISGIPKEHFLFATVKFFKENNLPRKYLFPDTIKEKLISLSNHKIIDLEAIDKITIISDHNIDKIVLNPLLKEKILVGMPNEFSELEKALYIYIKMCKLLTYDDEFYAVNQKGEVAREHEKIEHVTTITPTNNKVVCYEFNAIYGKLLQEIGLNFSTDQALINGFGGGHANLKFRSGKYLIKADSVTSILQSDMTNVKLNQGIVGLQCLNKNIQSQQEFRTLLTNIYTIIATQKEELQEAYLIEDNKEPMPDVPHTETFDEILAQYKKTTKQIVHISLAEKLDILMQKVNDSKLVGIDSLSYILHLRKIIFTPEERKENITITLIRDNELIEQNQIATSSAIIAINQTSLNNNPQDTLYYLYHPKISFSIIEFNELQNKFNEGTYSYIENKDIEIPGITQGGLKK